MSSRKGTVRKDGIEFLDIWPYRSDAYPFQIFIGARDGGKTYSYLKGLILKYQEDGKPFIYTRRLQSELEECADTRDGKETGNPFSKLNADMGWNYGFRPLTGKTAGLYQREWNDAKEGYIYTGQKVANGTSLASLSRIKGIDWQACDDWMYDEFIQEPHVPRMKMEGNALVSAYDTIARNRELSGLPPLHLTLCSNSTDIYHDVFITLKVVSILEKMARSGKQHTYIKERGLALHLMELPESLKKARDGTALGRLMKGTDYYGMAFENKFAYNDFSLVEYRKLNGYHCVAALDHAYIWKKKGESLWHVSYRSAPCEKYNSRHQQDEILFRRRIGVAMHDPYIQGRVTFESYELKALIVEHIF